MNKVFVFGIDGAFPEYVFGEWLEDLPNLKRLMQEGAYGKLNSTIPPLSATAWTSIFTGKTPADTSIFEYVYRKDYSYDELHVITSKNIKAETVWQIASKMDKKSIVCYVPLSWPIKPFNGALISGALTPSGESIKSVYPENLKLEIKDNFGEVPTPDLPNFRDLNEMEIVREVTKLTERQLDVAEYLLKNKEWDLFIEIVGLSDRMNHSFWKYMDPGHRKYDPNSEFKNVLKEYYKFVDKKLGDFLELLDEDTTVIIISDHGIKRLHNRVNLTDWLIQNNYMVLKDPINSKCKFDLSMVDWEKTRVFAIGAYEGQIFINLEGREPSGIVKKEDYSDLIEELVAKIKEIPGDNGKELDTKFFRKKDFFRGNYEDIAPDLIVYFDNLQYGCNNSLIGNETLWNLETAMGGDDSCHSQQGIFIMKNGKSINKNLNEVDNLDISPTILNNLGIEVPEGMTGKIIE